MSKFLCICTYIKCKLDESLNETKKVIKSFNMMLGASDAKGLSQELVLRLVDQHLKQVNPLVADKDSLKRFISAHTAGFDIKESVRAASAVNLKTNPSVKKQVIYDSTGGSYHNGELTLSLQVKNQFVIDGVKLSSTDNGARIIIKAQENPRQNGVYNVKINGEVMKLDRTQDFSDTSIGKDTATFYVEEGTQNGHQKWVFTPDATFSIGGEHGTPIHFTKWSGMMTVSNVGNGGVGIFKEIAGSDIKMRNMLAQNGAITVKLDDMNDCIVLDLNQTAMNISGMQGCLRASRLDLNHRSQYEQNKKTNATGKYEKCILMKADIIDKGEFEVKWSADVGNAIPGSKTKIRVNADGNTLQECVYTGSGPDEYQSFSGFGNVIYDNIKFNEVAMDFMALSGTAEVRNVRVTITQIK